MNYNAELQAYGFHFKKKCRCGGTLQEVFNHNEHPLEVRVYIGSQKKTVKIKEFGRVKYQTSLHNTTEFHEVIKRTIQEQEI